jgi:hypothetical protein
MTTISISHRRGNSFAYKFRLAEGWEGAHFTGGTFFTIRRNVPASSVVSDDDAVAVASTVDGRLTYEEIGGVEWGVIRIPASEANAWPLGNLLFDVETRIVEGQIVDTPVSGNLSVSGDITRSTPEWPE